MVAKEKWDFECLNCDQVAFSLKVEPHTGLRLMAADIIHEKGMKPGDKLKCQRCACEIPTSWLLPEHFKKNVCQA